MRRPLKSSPPARRQRRAARFAVVWGVLVLLLVTGCGLSLEEQKAHIRQGHVGLSALSVEAFLQTWGAPTYTHEERTQFFAVSHGKYIPRFRVPIGEPPPDWDSRMISDRAVFLAYADRGELLGFVDDRLIYREQLPPEQLHEIGKVWQRESLFKTRLETLPSSAPSR